MEIALDPEAEDGKGSVGSTAALNLDFTQTQTQATQATQGTQTQGPKVRAARRPPDTALAVCPACPMSERAWHRACSAWFMPAVL